MAFSKPEIASSASLNRNDKQKLFCHCEPGEAVSNQDI